MSTKWTVTLIVTSLLLAGCSGQRMATTVMTGENTDVKALVGARGGDVEIGGVVQYEKQDDINWGPEPTHIGAYVRYYLTQDVSIEDLPAWLEQLDARPYVGMDFMGSTDKSMRHVQPNWVVGTTFTLEEKVGDARAFINVAYVSGDQAAGDTFVGLSYLF